MHSRKTPAADSGSFAATEARIRRTHQRFPAFRRDAAVLVRLVRHIQAQVHDAANAILREHGLNHTDYNILIMLYGSADHAMNPSQLGGAAGEKSANLTRICNGLVDRGLVDRVADPHGDRRKVLLSLTRRGVELLEALLPGMTDLLDRCMLGFAPAERDQLERLLKRLLGNVEALVHPA
ncbi:MarR family transcriptional regulator [Dokdonella sp.]|uniref:MarR family winged helix-turn-helix transcriptional regulator n=1 Tax=Dokdonella sp. TaxID=2291710 RepID=UPI001B2AB6D9|nr:MarR family transcriptional regulator [Dokdonella sp.]MBO9664496.1 MarR family transcriptional regulator [Dokdonella sp.]